MRQLEKKKKFTIFAIAYGFKKGAWKIKLESWWSHAETQPEYSPAGENTVMNNRAL